MKSIWSSVRPVGFHLLAHQEALGDLHLLELGIAGEPDHFHAVLQGRRNGVQHVGGGDEEHLAQIVLHVQVMIHEHVVLLGVEHFEQRGRRIAAEIHRHLVDFVQHEDRIARAGLLHHLDDLAGQRADVGAAVAADFGLIAHAAERHADELAAGGLGDRHAERGLAHAGRSDEAENGALGILHQAAHRQEFEDALLDLLQAVVVGFEHLLRRTSGRGFPWISSSTAPPAASRGSCGDTVDSADIGGMFSSRFSSAMAFSSASVVMPAVFDALLQLVDLALLAAAQFLLDGLDLLVEVVLFLRLLHLALDAALDGAVDVELLDLDVEHLGHARQPVDGIEDFEQFLLLFDGELQVGAHGVGQLAGIVHPDGGDHGLVVQVLAELDVLLEQAGDAADQRVELRPGLHFEAGGAHDGAEEAFVVGDRNHLGALHAFHQNLDIAVRQLQALDDVDDGADAVDFVGLGFVDRGIVLGGKKDLLVAGHGLFERPHARFAPHHERGHHVRKDDHVADGHHRQTFCIGFFL